MNKTQSCFWTVIVLTHLGLLGGCVLFQQPSWNLPPGVSTHWVKDYPMAYMDRGTGPTVVLVHGAAQDYRWWDPQLDSLSPRFRTVAVSLRHYYPEPWDGKGEFSAKAHAEDLATFIERLGAGPVYLVAHSRGGLVAGMAAISRPDLVRKLVLMEPAFRFNKAVLARQLETAGTVAERMEKDGVEAGVSLWFNTTFGQDAWTRVAEKDRQRQLQNGWTLSRADASTVECTELGNLKMPVLLVGGEQSGQPLKNALSATQKCMPLARRVDIPKAGHAMNRQNPIDFDAAITKFLLE